MSMKDWLPYVDGLKSKTCICGKSKLRKKSFCAGCYDSLPIEMRTALYKKLGRGYEKAFDDAENRLNSKSIGKRGAVEKIHQEKMDSLLKGCGK